MGTPAEQTPAAAPQPAEPTLEQWAAAAVAAQEAAGLARECRAIALPPARNFASNDYLALSTSPEVLEALRHSTRNGASASRLVSGTFDAHLSSESLLADMCGSESALVFSSGYQANLAVLQAFVRNSDFVLADKYIHASMIDGLKLSGATFRRFRHNDLNHLETSLCTHQATRQPGQRVFILTEALFSINGDFAPLVEICELAERYDAYCIVDEAHSFGVFGPRGGGRAAALGVTDRLAAITGSFGKAVGAAGGFVACSSVLRQQLIGSARSFIYSTALPLSVAAASHRALEILAEEKRDRAPLFQLARRLREGLGLPASSEESYIIPLPCPGNSEASELAERLRQQDLFAYPMRSPTVPVGHECIRLSVTLHQDQSVIDELLAVVNG